MQILEPVPPRMRFTREQFDAMIASGVLHEDDRIPLTAFPDESIAAADLGL